MVLLDLDDFVLRALLRGLETSMSSSDHTSAVATLELSLFTSTQILAKAVAGLRLDVRGQADNLCGDQRTHFVHQCQIILFFLQVVLLPSGAVCSHVIIDFLSEKSVEFPNFLFQS